MFRYVYEKRKLNISDRAYVNQSLNSLNTESTIFGDCRFLAYSFLAIKPR